MKKNGFISKQLQKMIAPSIYEFMQVTHEICLDLINSDSYDDLLKSKQISCVTCINS